MITASIVIYKTKEDELNRVLQCVIDSDISRTYIVDNSPKDSLRILVGNYDQQRIVYIFGHGNVGFGSGNNIALRKAIEEGSKYHIVLNSDIIFESSAVKTLVDYLNVHKEIALVAPQLEYPDGRFQSSALLLPTPFIVFGRRFLPQNFVNQINKKVEFMAYDMTKPREVPNVCGCFMMIRTEILKQSGLFDERFFMYFEDFDFVRRVNNYGKVVYCPYSKVIHAHRNEHRKNKALLKAGLESGIKYFNKWGWFFDGERKERNRFSLSENSIIK